MEKFVIALKQIGGMGFKYVKEKGDFENQGEYDLKTYLTETLEKALLEKSLSHVELEKIKDVEELFRKFFKSIDFENPLLQTHYYFPISIFRELIKEYHYNESGMFRDSAYERFDKECYQEFADHIVPKMTIFKFLDERASLMIVLSFLRATYAKELIKDDTTTVERLSNFCSWQFFTAMLDDWERLLSIRMVDDEYPWARNIEAFKTKVFTNLLGDMASGSYSNNDRYEFHLSQFPTTITQYRQIKWLIDDLRNYYYANCDNSVTIEKIIKNHFSKIDPRHSKQSTISLKRENIYETLLDKDFIQEVFNNDVFNTDLNGNYENVIDVFKNFVERKNDSELGGGKVDEIITQFCGDDYKKVLDAVRVFLYSFVEEYDFSNLLITRSHGVANRLLPAKMIDEAIDETIKAPDNILSKTPNKLAEDFKIAYSKKLREVKK